MYESIYFVGQQSIANFTMRATINTFLAQNEEYSLTICIFCLVDNENSISALLIASGLCLHHATKF